MASPFGVCALSVGVSLAMYNVQIEPGAPEGSWLIRLYIENLTIAGNRVEVRSHHPFDKLGKGDAWAPA